MSKTYPFKWLDESENLIVVNVEVNEETVRQMREEWGQHDDDIERLQAECRRRRETPTEPSA